MTNSQIHARTCTIDLWKGVERKKGSQIKKKSTRDLDPRSQRLYAVMLPAVRPFVKGEAEPRLFVTPSNKIAKSGPVKKRTNREGGWEIADLAQASAYHSTPINAVNEKPSLYQSEQTANATSRTESEYSSRVKPQAERRKKQSKTKDRRQDAYERERQVMCTTTC